MGDNMDNISNYIAVIYGMTIFEKDEVQKFIRDLYSILKKRVGILNEDETLAIRECFGIVRGGDIDSVRKVAINSLDRQIKRILSDVNDRRLSVFDIDDSISNLKNIQLDAFDLPRYNISTILAKNKIYNIQQLVSCSTVKLGQIFSGRTGSYNFVVDKVHMMGLRFANELSVAEVNSDTRFRKLVLNNDVGFLDISNSTYRALCNAKVFSVGNLLDYSSSEVLNIRNMGAKSFGELNSALDKYGWCFKEAREDNYDEVDDLEKLLNMRDGVLADMQELYSIKDELDEQIAYFEKLGYSVDKVSGNKRVKKL